MQFLYYLSLCLSFHLVFGTDGESPIDPGLCSKKCQNVVQDIDSNNATTEALPKFPCSCTSSCSLYKDCCYDSEFRYGGTSLRMSHTMCLTVSGRGQYRVVDKCPTDWLESSHFCTESIGYLPPVTSTTTGTTYANIYCAVCHGDGEKLKTWSVDLRCCPEHDDLDVDADRHFVYRKGHLWSKVSNGGKCICRYKAQNNDSSFLDILELRTCVRRVEISKCSPSWSDGEDEERCRSFLDPLYLGDKIYRNQYCARCNYERPQRVQCEPAVVERMISEGANDSEIFEYCLKNRLRACLHYLSSLNRGRSYFFSNLLNIREESCIPDPGERCCRGERYDYRAKRCRKLL